MVPGRDALPVFYYANHKAQHIGKISQPIDRVDPEKRLSRIAAA